MCDDEAEFSPPLDTSLVAAIVADYVTDSTRAPSAKELRLLRKTLVELAAQAESQIGEDDLSAEILNIQLEESTQDGRDAESAADLFSAGTSTTNTAATSELSGSNQQSLSSPLKFLRTVFPHLPIARLKSALGSAEDADAIDMESIVEDIMSAEYARELEERGGEEVGETSGSVEQKWETVQPRSSSKKQKRKAAKTITLVDVRQKQHARTSSAPSSLRVAIPDPWTQLSSIASHLETLVPSRTAAYYQSVFHSPQYTTPSEALRAALSSIVPHVFASTNLALEGTQMLFGVFDILRESPVFKALSDVDREQMMSDAQTALRATNYTPDATLDVVWLLRELDGGEVDWGIYHSPVPTSPTLSVKSTPSNWQSKQTIQLPSGPPPLGPHREIAHAAEDSAPSSPLSPASTAWQTVPVSHRNTANPHAEFIPAYNDARNGRSKNNSGSQRAQKSHKERVGELMHRRREALREASRAWQRGNTSTRGGEVAFYFAERVRPCVRRPSLRRIEMRRAPRHHSDANRTFILC